MISMQKTSVKEFFEVSRAKPTLQSSISHWQKQENVKPGNAVSGIFTGEYSFHTNIEDNPWWMVDLQKSYKLRSIKIFNRATQPQRAFKIDIMLSVNAFEWHLLYSNDTLYGGVYDESPLIVDAKSRTARFVRLEIRERTCFHLDQVQIFAEN